MFLNCHADISALLSKLTMSPLRCTYKIAVALGLVWVGCSLYVSTGPLRDLHEPSKTTTCYQQTPTVYARSTPRREEEVCTYEPFCCCCCCCGFSVTHMSQHRFIPRGPSQWHQCCSQCMKREDTYVWFGVVGGEKSKPASENQQKASHSGAQNAAALSEAYATARSISGR
jgi:hypothetical protein